jgi:hypothetical protein
MFPEYYPESQNIGPFKYRFLLSIFQINYSIDDIDYRLSHVLFTFITNRSPHVLRQEQELQTTNQTAIKSVLYIFYFCYASYDKEQNLPTWTQFAI